jgi:purine-cytosine permease-like protein
VGKYFLNLANTDAPARSPTKKVQTGSSFTVFSQLFQSSLKALSNNNGFSVSDVLLRSEIINSSVLAPLLVIIMVEVFSTFGPNTPCPKLISTDIPLGYVLKYL